MNGFTPRHEEPDHYEPVKLSQHLIGNGEVGMEKTMGLAYGFLFAELGLLCLIGIILGIRFLGPSSLRHALGHFYHRHITHFGD